MRMTEAEWRKCEDVEAMLSFLFKSTTRKRHLFACACCRRIWVLLTDERSRAAVQLAEERFADNRSLKRSQMSEARAAAEAAAREARTAAARFAAFGALEALGAGECGGSHIELTNWCAAAAAADVPPGPLSFAPQTVPVPRHSATQAEWIEGNADIYARERVAQAALVRDVWGPLPFRSIAIDPAWRAWNDGTIPNLASVIYRDRRFEDLPVLGDALEEAGCADADLLTHCRADGEHVRGCWVVDLLLERI
jgi:hypothetical protein